MTHVAVVVCVAECDDVALGRHNPGVGWFADRQRWNGEGGHVWAVQEVDRHPEVAIAVV